MNIQKLVNKLFKVEMTQSKELGGYDCKNYLIKDSNGKAYVLKKHLEKNIKELLKEESEILLTLSNKYPGIYQKPILSVNNRFVEEMDGYYYRLVHFIEGELIANMEHSEQLLNSFGEEMAQLHLALKGKKSFVIEANKRYWDIQYFEISEQYRPFVNQTSNTKLLDYFIQHFNQFIKPQFIHLRKGLIHGDANDLNVIGNQNKVTGIIDFGDITNAPIIIDIAIALTYLLFDKEEPIKKACHFLKGYHAIHPLEQKELDVLYYLIATRCCQSILNASYSAYQNPENKAYIEVSQKNIWKLLEDWIQINPLWAKNQFYKTCHFEIEEYNEESILQDQNKRDQILSKALSINPIHMVGAAFQYMYAADGSTYLDLRNNIPHVGHCHPKVVAAGQKQMALLNTNSRYYYDALHEYADALLAKFPPSLNKVFFVNSGSAASDLAFRLATTISGSDKIMAMEEAYHGNTFKAIEVSHYKYSHAGGNGQGDHILKAPMPWNWPFKYGKNASEILSKKALEIIEENKDQIAAFIAEPIIGCGGQLELPKDYLRPIYKAIRAQGGYCISDEVQTGFARLGENWWGFEQYAVVPDIVVTGKCIGNGHPMAAVICTDEVAKKFNNGMEFFSSYGGNPVSCQVGKAVLDVIEEEQLQQNTIEVSQYFFEVMTQLKSNYECVGSIRGKGFFIGIEFVNNKVDYKANQTMCAFVKEYCKAHYILLGSDGPFDNVLKIKPPLCFTKYNVDKVIHTIEQGIKHYDWSRL